MKSQGAKVKPSELLGLGSLNLCFCMSSNQDRTLSNQRNYFLSIMILILLCMISRIVFLMIIFVPDNYQFSYLLFTDNLTILFKMLTVIHYCRYKLHIYYVATFRLASAGVRWAILALEGVGVLMYIGAGFAFCSSIPASEWIWIDLTP